MRVPTRVLLAVLCVVAVAALGSAAQEPVVDEMMGRIPDAHPSPNMFNTRRSAFENPSVRPAFQVEGHHDSAVVVALVSHELTRREART